MSENNQNKIYSAEEIRAYLDGRMNNAEMLALEKAALEDPFLADAIEGMQEAQLVHGEQRVQTGLEDAYKQLAERVKEQEGGRVVAFPWKQLAAAAVIVLIAGIWFFTSNNKEDIPSSEIAKVEETQAKPSVSEPPAVNEESNIKDSISDSSKAEVSSNTDADRLAPEKKSEETKNAKPSRRNKDVAGKAENFLQQDRNADSNKESDKLEEVAQAPVQIQRKAVITPSAPPTKSQEVLRDDQEFKTTAQSYNQLNRFNGKIVDSNNIPVGFATISLANNRNAFVTDQHGFFSIPSADTVLTVNVTGVGYNSRSFELKNNVALNQLELERNNANLNEVVVTGMGTEKKKSRNAYSLRLPKVMVQDAEPVVGWIEYNKYLESSKKTLTSSDSGEVVVSFSINKSNQLSSFKVEQSLSDEQDKEAIRLVKEGPGWKLLKGKKAKVYVIVKF